MALNLGAIHKCMSSVAVRQDRESITSWWGTFCFCVKITCFVTFCREGNCPQESNHTILCRICRVNMLHVHFVLHVVSSVSQDRKQYFHSTSCHPWSFHLSVTVSHLVSLVPSHPFLFALGLLSPVFLKPLAPSLYFHWCLSCFICPCVCVCV